MLRQAGRCGGARLSDAWRGLCGWLRACSISTKNVFFGGKLKERVIVRSATPRVQGCCRLSDAWRGLCGWLRGFSISSKSFGAHGRDDHVPLWFSYGVGACE
jgi:hypothetical protein